MVLALVAPGLVVAGAPWRRPGAWPGRGTIGRRPPAPPSNACARWRWRYRPSLAWSPGVSPAAVNALRPGGWLLALEVSASASPGRPCGSSASARPRLVPARPEAAAHRPRRREHVDDLGARLSGGDVRTAIGTAVTFMSPAMGSAWSPTSRARPASCGPWPALVLSPSSSSTFCNGCAARRTPTRRFTAWSREERRRALPRRRSAGP